MAHRRQSRNRGGGGTDRREREWVGGLLELPFFVTDREEPYRPTCAVWMDGLDDLVVGQDVVEPEEKGGALGRALLAALEQPMAGPRRRPGRLRVATPELAAEVRAAWDDPIPIRVAPTPELEQLADFIVEHAAEVAGDGDGESDESYLEEGRVSEAAAARLFDAARLLWAAAPWKQAMDFQALRLDIPSRGVEGACVSIIGNAGDQRGLVIFPSLEALEAFTEAGPTLSESARHIDLGTGWLALTYASASELPETMRREAMEHGWAVAGAGAYPRVERRERDGVLRPLVERDLEIASRCATAIAAFSLRHGQVFEEEDFEPICESQFGEDDVEVRLTLPYEAYDDFDLPEPPPLPRRASPRVGRNDPCPCGSGRKYKKCHLARDEARDAARADAARLRDLDGRLVRQLLGLASRRFGDDWESHADAFADVDSCLQLAVPWSVYGYPVGGRTAAEVYLEEHGARLSREERSWLAAQRAAWLSVWEVTRVEPGEALALRDLLSGEERRVREVSASQGVVVGDAVLARVVDYEGTSVLSGAHPHTLAPSDAADLVRRARGRLRLRRAVPVERLRDPEFGRYLIGRWDAAIDEPDGPPTGPPRERTDPLSLRAARGGPAPMSGPPPAEAERIVLDFKRAHYADWPDHPLPALGGRTPREAVRSAEGRRAVGRLLDEMERDERRWEGATAFDFGKLRRELRLK